MKYLVILAALFALFGWFAAPHSFPWAAFHNELPFFLSLLLLAHFAWKPLEDRALPGVHLPRFAIFLFAVSLIPLVQYVFGTVYFFGDAFVAALYVAAFALACSVGYRLGRVRSSDTVAALAAVFLFGSIVSVFLATSQWLILDAGWWVVDLAPGGRPYANLAQPNNLGTLLCCGLAASIYLEERGRISFPLHVLLALLLCAGIAMTRSRTVLLIAIGFLVLYLVYRKRLQLRASALRMMGGFAFFFSVWALWPALSAALLLHADSSLVRIQQMGSEVRLLLWQQLLDAALRNPLRGYGWNQVSVAQVAVAHEYPNTVFVEHSHNLVIDLLVWNGVLLGGALVIAGVWWVVSRAIRISSCEGWFAMLVVAAIGTHALLEFPVEYAYFLLPLGICLGVIESQHDSSRTLAIPRAFLHGSLALGWFLAFCVTWEYQLIQFETQRTRYQAAGIVVESESDLPSPGLLTQQDAFLRFVGTQATEEMSPEQIDWMRKVAHRYAYPPALFRYALALALNHRYEAAERELQRLGRLHRKARFDEAREGWALLSERYEQLQHVALHDLRP